VLPGSEAQTAIEDDEEDHRMPKLTKRLIDSLEAEPDRDRFVWDSKLTGFGLRLTRTGRKSYLIQYRNAFGRSRRMTLGTARVLTPDQARKEAARLLARVRQGEDPAEDRRQTRHGLTFKQLAERYLDHHLRPKRKRRSVEDCETCLRLHILPRIGSRKAASLTRTDIKTIHRKMASMPYAANRSLNWISAILNHAEQAELRPPGSNPCRLISRYPEPGRDRYLTPAELTRLGETLAEAERTHSLHPSARLAIRLLALSGMRRNEVLCLRWAEVDFERSCLHLGDSKTGRKRVPLAPPALELLHRAERVAGNPYVCWGEKAGKHYQNIHQAWKKVRSACGLEDVRLHDLRHTFASFGVKAGFGLFVVGKVLGHRQTSTTERYAHLGADPVTFAADAIGKELAEAMGHGVTGSHNFSSIVFH
jgi:integrase